MQMDDWIDVASKINVKSANQSAIPKLIDVED